jgi:hypothetical protein
MPLLQRRGGEAMVAGHQTGQRVNVARRQVSANIPAAPALARMRTSPFPPNLCIDLYCCGHPVVVTVASVVFAVWSEHSI